MRYVSIPKGGTLSQIAQQEHISLKALLFTNANLDPRRIQIGQKIAIPETEEDLLAVAEVHKEHIHKTIEKKPEKEVGNEPKQCKKCSKTWDKYTNRRLEKLHPKIKCKAFDFINEVERKTKIKLRVVQGLRTIQQQNALYAQGRTKPGTIVTKAPGGRSYHNYGLAIDVAEVRRGKIIWNLNWKKVVPIAKKYGFEWGGEWRSFKDKPHFQITFGYTTKQLFHKYKKGEVENGYVKL